METIDTLRKIQNRNKALPGLSRIIDIAQGDSGGSRVCAMFLLSLWDGGIYKTDLQDLLYIDSPIFEQMLSILAYLHGTNNQIDSFVSQNEMDPVIKTWGKQFETKFETE